MINLKNNDFKKLIEKNKKETSFANVVQNTAEYISECIEKTSSEICSVAQRLIVRNNLVLNRVDVDPKIFFNGVSHVLKKTEISEEDDEIFERYIQDDKIPGFARALFENSEEVAKKCQKNYVVGANNGLATIMGLVNVLRSKCSDGILNSANTLEKLISNFFGHTVEQFSRIPMVVQDLMQSEWGIKSRLHHKVFPIDANDFELKDIREVYKGKEEKLALISKKEFLEDTIKKYHEGIPVWTPVEVARFSGGSLKSGVAYEKKPLVKNDEESAGCSLWYVKTKSGKVFMEEFNNVVKYALEQSVLPFIASS